MDVFDYDDTDPNSILSYGKQAEGKTFREILTEYDKNPYKTYESRHNYLKTGKENLSASELKSLEATRNLLNLHAKGRLGNVTETFLFGLPSNSRQEADFKRAEVELKQTPIDRVKKSKKSPNGYSAGERLSITNISYTEPVEDDFYKSHLWDKLKCMLLVQYLRDKDADDLDYPILFVNLFSPPKEDLQIIINDYNLINQKIKDGKAHELSEGDTIYLGACTKGTTAAKSLRNQYYGDHKPAKKRNFCLKRSYMQYVLDEYVLKGQVPCESIIKGNEVTDFRNYVMSLINKHAGMSDRELCQLYDYPYDSKSKAFWSALAFRMLGVKSNRVAEFQKANIIVKTVRVENGQIKENIPITPAHLKELPDQSWEESPVYNYFETTQILFVVFEKQGADYVMKKSVLWHMPYQDLNETVKQEWLDCQRIVKEGIVFTKKTQADNKIVINNNLPAKKETEIIHLRPHTQKAAYKLKDGYCSGDIQKDGEELPNGEFMTKQDFWLNNDYVLKQLKLNENEASETKDNS